jgi:hypothetical protein
MIAQVAAGSFEKEPRWAKLLQLFPEFSNGRSAPLLRLTKKVTAEFGHTAHLSLLSTTCVNQHSLLVGRDGKVAARPQRAELPARRECPVVTRGAGWTRSNRNPGAACKSSSSGALVAVPENYRRGMPHQVSQQTRCYISHSITKGRARPVCEPSINLTWD